MEGIGVLTLERAEPGEDVFLLDDVSYFNGDPSSCLVGCPHRRADDALLLFDPALGRGLLLVADWAPLVQVEGRDRRCGAEPTAAGAEEQGPGLVGEVVL